jgi:two-component system osmolarity sensor histidine kinase EnvZ
MAVSSAPPGAAARRRAFLARNWMPRSFYGRAALILIVPVLAIQLAVAVAFLQRHYEDVTVQMTDNLSREIALLRERPELGPRLEIDIDEEPVADYVRWWDLSGRAMRERLEERFPEIAAIDVSGTRKRIAVGFDDGQRMAFDRSNVSASNPHQLLVLMVFTAALMTLVSSLFMRGQIRPIRRLAQAAEAFGRGEIREYRPSGALEVRAAGTAFLEMRGRIERHIEQRTLLLSGVSHDLRTPLTRMRLELAMMGGTEAAALGADLDAMERIIDTFLDFSRETAGDARREVDLAELLAETVDQDGARGAVELRADPLRVAVYPERLRRAVGNLLANARRYGTAVRVDLRAGPGSIVIAVDDDGPGIPEAHRDDAIKPFARLDGARSNTAGNVGLGLSIVRDVARAHGGALRLGRSEMGGLKAEIVIPR